jgi:hypothetical protein
MRRRRPSGLFAGRETPAIMKTPSGRGWDYPQEEPRLSKPIGRHESILFEQSSALRRPS